MSGIAQKYMPNMENEGRPYYEQYAVEDSDQNTTNKRSAPYYEQYAVEEEPKKGLWEKAKDLTAYPEIFGSAAYSGLRALPRTGFDLLKSLVSAAGGNIKDIEESQENAPEWLKKAGSYVFPTYEEQSKEMQERGSPKPEGFLQKATEKAGRFLGEGPATGGIGGLRGAAGLGGAALGLQLGEEAKLPPLAQAALAMGGGILAHKATGSPRAGLASASKQRLTPEAERYVQASRELGVDPLLTGMNPTQLQRVAQKWATHGRGGHDILKNAYETRSAQVANSFHQAMEEVGQNLFHEPLEAGVALQEGVRDATRQVEQTKSQLYRQMEHSLPEGSTINVRNPNEFRGQVDQTLRRLEDSLAHTPAERGVDTRLNAIRDELEQLIHFEGNGIPVERLQATQRSLRDVIKYDHPGGVDKLLIPVDREITGLLDRFGEANPQWNNAREAANDYFKNQVVQIRQNVLQSIARGEKPELALQLMNHVSGIRNVEQALSHLPHGGELFDALKRFKLRSLIGDKIISPETGLMKLGGVKNFLSKKTDFYPVLRELAGPQGIERLQRLEHVGQGLEKGFNNLVNPSGTADVLVALNSILSPGKKIAEGLGKVPTPEGFLKIAHGLTEFLAPEALSRIILDPAFANQVYEASQAANRGNWGVFNRRMISISHALKEKQDEESKKSNNKTTAR